MANINRFITVMVCICAITACKHNYIPQSVSYSNYQINPTRTVDSSYIHFLQPYTDSVQHSMNKVIGKVSTTLEKAQPDGSLNAVMADAALIQARLNYKKTVDVAVLNYGGIRIASITPGDLTNGKVFEMMPFDNILVLQTLKGSVLQQLLDHMAAAGGWPVAGITMKIKDKKAVDVLINNKPIDPAASYTMATNDYLANGGDYCDMLKGIPQVNNGYLLRQALLDYFSNLQQQGKEVTAPSLKRIENVQ